MLVGISLREVLQLTPSARSKLTHNDIRVNWQQYSTVYKNQLEISWHTRSADSLGASRECLLSNVLRNRFGSPEGVFPKGALDKTKSPITTVV